MISLKLLYEANAAIEVGSVSSAIETLVSVKNKEDMKKSVSIKAVELYFCNFIIILNYY